MAFLVFYGGMLDIDASLLEAAKVDGSNRWKDFWFIILPLIKPQLKIMIILTFIGCIQDYGGIFLLIPGRAWHRYLRPWPGAVLQRHQVRTLRLRLRPRPGDVCGDYDLYADPDAAEEQR